MAHLMATFVDWAKCPDEQQQEHVTFPSFVKEFELLDKDKAIMLYEELLESPRLRLGRRNQLKANFAEFTQRRLDTFWSSWENMVELGDIQKELDDSAEIVAKKYAVKASREDSSKISNIL
ncbi:hypothetical protein BGZ49_005885, partial [Haplosporangium sp. Z 27]